MKNRLKLIVLIFLGFVAGGIISILELPFNFGLILLFLVWGPVAMARSKSRFETRGYLVVFAVGVVTIVVAILLPVKQLDGQVGPMDYERISLRDLSQRLRDDWDIRIMTCEPEAANTFLTFKTEERMSRRQVLEKLADETSRDLTIGYCGTGATFLFGANPSFTTLHPRQGGRSIAERRSR